MLVTCRSSLPTVMSELDHTYHMSSDGNKEATFIMKLILLAKTSSDILFELQSLLDVKIFCFIVGVSIVQCENELIETFGETKNEETSKEGIRCVNTYWTTASSSESQYIKTEKNQTLLKLDNKLLFKRHHLHFLCLIFPYISFC